MNVSIVVVVDAVMIVELIFKFAPEVEILPSSRSLSVRAVSSSASEPQTLNHPAVPLALELPDHVPAFTSAPEVAPPKVTPFACATPPAMFVSVLVIVVHVEATT